MVLHESEAAFLFNHPTLKFKGQVCENELVNYGEFKRHVAKAGLQINEFAALIGVQATSISKYAKGEIPTKYAVLAVLLGDAVDRKHDVRSLLIHHGMTWPVAANVATLADYRRKR